MTGTTAEMTGTAAAPAATRERRLDLRLTERDYMRLKRAASEHFRSPNAEARYLIVRALKAEQNNGGKGGR